MGIPTQESMELPLLYEIERAGGFAKPRDVYDRVAKHFTLLTEEDRRLINVSGGLPKFENRVQFTRNDLVKKGELDNTVRGLWKITQKGKERVAREWPSAFTAEYTDRTKLILGKPRVQRGRHGKGQTPVASMPPGATPSLVGSPVTTRPPQPADIRAQVLERVQALDDTQFERFCGRLLEAMGFEDFKKTGGSHDRGIDGHVTLRHLGFKVAFQAKNWRNNQVGSRQVREFRGSIVNRYPVGIYITTSSFSSGAQEEADEPGPPQVVLVDGDRLVDIMLEKGLGVRTVPVTKQEVAEEFFTSF